MQQTGRRMDLSGYLQRVGVRRNETTVCCFLESSLLDAQSGKDNFQSAKYQNRSNAGPLPEGTYYADQDQRQNLTLKKLVLKLGEKVGLNTDQKVAWSGYPWS